MARTQPDGGGITLALGAPADGAERAGGSPRPTPARTLTSPASGSAGSPDVADQLPSLTVLVGGAVVGELRLMPTRHPDALAGSTAAVVVTVRDTAPEPANWLADALRAVERYAQQAVGLATLLARPVDGEEAILAALATAGYDGPGAGGWYRRELLSTFWRRGAVFVIAEAGSNWRMGTPARDLAMARALIDVAAEAGADAVKFQTFRPETVYVAEAGASDYLSEVGMPQDIRDIFADIAMPYDMLPVLAEHASTRGIAFMSTPFSAADFAAVDPHVTVHKIASYEITHIRVIELAARSGKPTVLSTGAATLEDIEWAVGHYHSCGGRDLCLMQCTAKYPTPPEALNIRVLPELERRFKVPVGLSDHSRDPVAGPLAATALGARALEKHFTLDNRLPGPDHPFALTPDELAELVTAVRAASAVCAGGLKEVLDGEAELAAFAQRGVQAITDIRPGDVFEEDGNVGILRAGKQPKGIHPRHLARLANRRATRALRPGEGVREGDWVDD